MNKLDSRQRLIDEGLAYWATFCSMYVGIIGKTQSACSRLDWRGIEHVPWCGQSRQWEP